MILLSTWFLCKDSSALIWHTKSRDLQAENNLEILHIRASAALQVFINLHRKKKKQQKKTQIHSRKLRVVPPSLNVTLLVSRNIILKILIMGKVTIIHDFSCRMPEPLLFLTVYRKQSDCDPFCSGPLAWWYLKCNFRIGKELGWFVLSNFSVGPEQKW